MKNRQRILCFSRYYLPGYRAGGPIRTLSSMFDNLAAEFEFFLVTLNRDMGQDSPYGGVVPNRWTSVGNVNVLYVDPGKFAATKIPRLVREVAPDALYINSFWDGAFSQPILWLRRFGLLPDIPVVLAPRGEFSPGALRIKRLRKRTYLFLNRLVGFTDGLFWHASSSVEQSYIKRAVRRGGVVRIQVAENLNSIIVRDFEKNAGETAETSRPLRVCFLSRISKMKNLDYALHTLWEVEEKVEFDIYGPIEDEGYWKVCEALMDALPSNVRCVYKGEIQPDSVSETLQAYDLFYLPTRGENYGHVIIEALAAGVPVLISDQTPWGHVEGAGCGWAFDLKNRRLFTDCINTMARMTSKERFVLRTKAVEYARKKAEDLHALEANRALFNVAMESWQRGSHDGC